MDFLLNKADTAPQNSDHPATETAVEQIAGEAARIANVWRAQRQAADATAADPLLPAFSQSGIHRSVHPVFPVGSRIFLRLSEIERWIQKAGDGSPWRPLLLARGYAGANMDANPLTWKEALASAWTKQLQEEGKSSEMEARLATIHQVMQELSQEGYIHHGDLYDLISLVKREGYSGKETGEALDELSLFAKERSPWHTRIAIEEALGAAAKLPEVERWLRNYDYHLPLEEQYPTVIGDSLAEAAGGETPFSAPSHRMLHYLFAYLQRSERTIQDLETPHSGVFKTSIESFYELVHVHIAKQLGLEHLVVQGAVVSLPGATVLPPKKQHQVDGGPMKNPIGLLQPYIKDGLKPSTLHRQVQQNDPLVRQVKISNQEFQEASLFLGITKQADLHHNNAYFVPDEHGGWHLKLFDLARGLMPDGFVERGDEHKVAFRTFLVKDPYYQEPLTEESVALIKSWDLAQFRDAFLVDGAWTSQFHKDVSEIQNLHRYAEMSGWGGLEEELDLPARAAKSDLLKEIRQRESALTKNLERWITPEQFIPMARRIKDLQDLIAERERLREPRPTIQECYERMLPLEMKYFSLYERALGPGGSIETAKVTIEDCIERGALEGTLSEKEKQEWLETLKEDLAAASGPRLTRWIYPG